MSTDNRLGNLSNVFAGTTPRKRLADLPQVDSTPTPAPEPAPVTTAPPSAARAGDTPAKRRPRERSASAGLRTTSVSIPIHLSDAITDAVSAAPAGDRLTAAEVMLNAVEATVDRLPELVRNEQAQPTPVGSLFPDPKSNVRLPGEQRVIRALATTPANLEVLDNLTKKTGAASRSQLITAALRDYLT